MESAYIDEHGGFVVDRTKVDDHVVAVPVGRDGEGRLPPGGQDCAVRGEWGLDAWARVSAGERRLATESNRLDAQREDSTSGSWEGQESANRNIPLGTKEAPDSPPVHGVK